MAKILLVEDDQSLREIYSIRLTAEGYEIVTAGDGEEALATAVKERPDLVLSDVMMPKISGFDMLDILRSTPETKDIRVIMMTALSSDDQRQRGENLGADRYLVKSQVGIEDVVNTIHEVMGDLGSPVPVDTPAGGANTEAQLDPALAPQAVSEAGSISVSQPTGEATPVVAGSGSTSTTPVVPEPTSPTVATPENASVSPTASVSGSVPVAQPAVQNVVQPPVAGQVSNTPVNTPTI